MFLIILVLTRQDYRRLTVAMALKVGLVIAICVIFFQRDRIPSSKALMRAFTFANVAVLAVPPLHNERPSIAIQLLALALLTPRDIVAESSRAYWWAYIGVLTMTHLHSAPFQVQSLAFLVALLPCTLPLGLGQSVERVITYRCIGMLVFLLLPYLWTRSTPLEKTLFRKPPPHPTSLWNHLSDRLASLDDHQIWRASIFGINTFLLARAAFAASADKKNV